MRIHYKHFPGDIKEQYGIDELKADNDYVYVKIEKGMYGLKQAAILAYENLMNNLRQYGYQPVPHALGIWMLECVCFLLSCVCFQCKRICLFVCSFMDIVCDSHGYVSSSTYWSCIDLGLILCGFTRIIYNAFVWT